MPQPEKRPIEILVLGDWTLDENWILAKHRSPYGGGNEESHFRALGDIRSKLLELCGAGRVARFLYWCNRFQEGSGEWIDPSARSTPAFSIFGLGSWSFADESEMHRMFHPTYATGLNPFTLKGKNHLTHVKQLDGLHLARIPFGNDDAGTTRVYRLFRPSPDMQSGLKLDRRVDFELRHPTQSGAPGIDLSRLRETLRSMSNMLGDSGQMTKISRLRYLSEGIQELLDSNSGAESATCRKLLSLLEDARTETDQAVKTKRRNSNRTFRYVVVRDLEKGGISLDLLNALREAKLINRNTQWFVSSRGLRPRFLPLARRDFGCLRLLFLPARAATQAEHSASEGFVPRWFAGELEPTRESLRVLREISSRCSGDSPHFTLVAMPRGLSLIALEKQNAEEWVHYQPKPALDETEEGFVGRAGMFFAALVAELIRNESSRAEERGEDSAGRKMEVALAAASDFLEGQLDALRSVGDESRLAKRPVFYDPSFLKYRRAEEQAPQTRPRLKVTSLSWDDFKRKINDTPATGIIKTAKGDGYELELWRSMSVLDGYIEVSSKRRRRIAELLMALKEFMREPAKRSLSVMLVAPPGAGKSYLVSRIAGALGAPYLLFNATQLIRRENVISCFDEIASAQAKDHSRKQIVFFDEIKSPVEELQVYDLFLTALEDGTYLRGGKPFRLDPCAWIFADTTDLSYVGGAPKEPDFRSRMTLESISLDEAETPAERIYGLVCRGAYQLQVQHNDVGKISAAVLKAFSCLGEDGEYISNRQLRHLALRFRNIRYGEVRVENMPEELRSSLGRNGAKIASPCWRDLVQADEGDGDEDLKLDNILVELRRLPPRS